MPSPNPNRRQVFLGVAASAFVPGLPVIAQNRPALHVIKDPNCGCCGGWINIMAQSGFDVTVQNVSNDVLFSYKLGNGITEDLASCHTGLIEGYLIEGHVPPADVRRLLTERPDAIGLSVPGMPFGAPGMGPEDDRDAYDVVLMNKDGTTEIYASYDGQ